VVKVAVDKNNFALYFSRSPIPFIRDKKKRDILRADDNALKEERFYKHIGLYAYTKDFLFTFANLPQSFLEQYEKLEQLRALENGYRIMMIETGYDTVGVDTPEDLERAKTMIDRPEEQSLS
jgi:3-deoxy-manno-octulosonate cytidylyltransferase (CMP-KDO synthetase)